MNSFIGIGSDSRFGESVVEMMSSVDIPQRWHGTPIEAFIQAQNFGYPLAPQAKPQVLISACMEFRYALPVPHNYAYVIRTAGGRLIGAELAIAYAVSRGVTNLLLIAHNDCGMTKLLEHKAEIIEAFVDQGWSQKQALNYFNSHEAKYAIKNELESLQVEYFRLKKVFKKIHVAPLFLTLSDKRVYLPRWYVEFINQKGDQEGGTVLEEDIAALI